MTSKQVTSPPWNSRRGAQAKKWLGHCAGRSPCAHSIGKFFLCYIVLFLLETSAPGLSGHYWYWMEGVYNQEMPILWWPSYLANLAKHWWINLWARFLHDWPSRIACGLAHLPKLHWICHVDLWICVALSLHPGREKPCLHLLHSLFRGPMPKSLQVSSVETSSMVQYQNPVHTQLLCRACHWKSWEKRKRKSL